MGFPKLGVPFLGASIMRAVVFRVFIGVPLNPKHGVTRMPHSFFWLIQFYLSFTWRCTGTGTRGFSSHCLYGGFPKLGVPFWGVPIVRTLVFWGLYWGPLILGNYHISLLGLGLQDPCNPDSGESNRKDDGHGNENWHYVGVCIYHLY